MSDLFTIVPVNTGAPVLLPSATEIAGSPPPMLPAIKLATWNRLKESAGPIMSRFSAPQDRTSSI